MFHNAVLIRILEHIGGNVFPSDLDIARSAPMKPLAEIAEQMGIGEHLLEPYGRNVAKIRLEAIDDLAHRPRARYVVVTAITPTPLGEGKTTTTVGLGQAMKHVGKQAVISVRQPSMGPTFGIKGGAAGGGYSQVLPMEQLNLHLTGDFHAVTSAHNLLAAMVDNHLFHGNELGLDLDNITWRRVLDVNDRALRNIVVGIGPKADGVTRQTGFDITASSEVMAILALATLARRPARPARTHRRRLHDGRRTGHRRAAPRRRVDGGHDARRDHAEPAPDVGAHAGDRPRRSLRQHRHGNSSVIGDLVGIHGGDYLVTEAGFGADMGAERFFNIKCRASGLVPDAAVLVATVRALKAHSGKYRVVAGKPLPPDMLTENPDDVIAGAANLRKQIENVVVHGVSPVVAINAFPGDHRSEHDAIRTVAEEMGVRVAVCNHFSDGGAGAVELAEAVVEACEQPSAFRFLYPLESTLRKKIETIATTIYGASGVDYSPVAQRQLDTYERSGFGGLPICMAKTHLSVSADPTLVGAPTGHRLPVREVRANAGAGFVYPICGEMRTMPGLGTHPAAAIIDLDDDGEIVGLS